MNKRDFAKKMKGNKSQKGYGSLNKIPNAKNMGEKMYLGRNEQQRA